MLEPEQPSQIDSPIDLTNCDREPIHVPGSIQPHGVLLVLSEPDLTIIQLSSNTERWLGYAPEALLNQPLSMLLSKEQLDKLVSCLSEDFESVNPLSLSIQAIAFDGIIHRYAGVLILELEPSQSQEAANFFGFYHLVKGTIAKLQNAHTLSQMCEVIVKEVQQLTQFDRVMVYRFDPEGAGQVIAEAKRDSLTPYLGLHYPASDVPKQAKQLYTLNGLRLIPDVDYQPAELIPAIHPHRGQVTDLSLSVLRSVSPLHIEYLHNMGVAASMSISLVRNQYNTQRLWGLIACHHHSARYLSYEVRTACEFLGQVMSLELNNKEETEDLDYKMKLKSIQSRFIDVLPQQETLLDGLLCSETNLLDLTGATGAAISWDDQLYTVGRTPEPEQLADLLTWIETQLDGNLFSTAALPEVYPESRSYQAIASGVLALAISRTNRNYVLWFRPEVVQTVNWGGNPNKFVEVLDTGEVRMSPRKSFAAWQETVRGRSLPWKQCEIDTVLDLRSAIVGIVLKQSDELAKINLELKRSNYELDSFAYIASHDLKEPLRGIHNYSNFLIEDYADLLSEDGVSKLQTLVRLTQRMEDLINSLLHFSRLGRAELDLQPTNLRDLVQMALEILHVSLEQANVEMRIPHSLPNVMCDRVQMSEVFTNLISNAIKYNDREHKMIEVGVLNQSPEMITVYVRDNGIGIPERHLNNIFRIFKRLHASSKYGGGTGAGLTIAKKIVERHGGEMWVESIAGEGSTFYFTVLASQI